MTTANKNMKTGHFHLVNTTPKVITVNLSESGIIILYRKLPFLHYQHFEKVSKINTLVIR